MSKQGKVDEICNTVQKVFNPERIRFMKIASYPASTGMRISFDYHNDTKIITFSKEYIDQHSETYFANFIDKSLLSELSQEGEQHLRLG